MAFISMLLAVMFCTMAVLPARDNGRNGQSGNGIIKLYINGEDVSGQLEKQEDGSYTRQHRWREKSEGNKVEIGKDAEKVFRRIRSRFDIIFDEAITQN